MTKGTPFTTPSAREAAARMTGNLFNQWQLASAEQQAALGGSRLGDVARGEPGAIERAAQLLQIHEHLRALLQNRRLVPAWLRSPNRSFEGQAPLVFIMKPSNDGLLRVRAHLEGALNGGASAPATDAAPAPALRQRQR